MRFGFITISLDDQYHNGLGQSGFLTKEEAIKVAESYMRVLHSSRDENATYEIIEES